MPGQEDRKLKFPSVYPKPFPAKMTLDELAEARDKYDRSHSVDSPKVEKDVPAK